jgi:hypothetical protein
LLNTSRCQHTQPYGVFVSNGTQGGGQVRLLPPAVPAASMPTPLCTGGRHLRRACQLHPPRHDFRTHRLQVCMQARAACRLLSHATHHRCWLARLAYEAFSYLCLAQLPGTPYQHGRDSWRYSMGRRCKRAPQPFSSCSNILDIRPHILDSCSQTYVTQTYQISRRNTIHIFFHINLGTYSNVDGSRQPSRIELDIAKHQATCA